MKYISYEICPKCGNKFDSTLGECPKCQERGVYFDLKEKYLHQSRVGQARNILLFLIGFLGFQILGVVFSIIAGSIAKINNPSADLETLLYQPNIQMAVNASSYLVVALILFLVIKGCLPEITKSFKERKNIFIGLGWGVILIIASTILSLWASRIYPNSGGGNTNQSILVALIGEYPLASILIFAFVGPAVEELAYRVGLFSLTSRLNKVLGFVISTLVFAFLHFDFYAIGTEQIIVELLNLPSYLMAGLLLSYVYDRYGLSASYAAHFLNNFVSVALIILGSNI